MSKYKVKVCASAEGLSISKIVDLVDDLGHTEHAARAFIEKNFDGDELIESNLRDIAYEEARFSWGVVAVEEGDEE